MKVRKIVASLAAVSMLAAFSAQAVLAADSVTISADKVTAEAGAAFSVNVTLSGVPSAGVNAAEFTITYDPSIITVTGVSAGSIVNTSADAEEGLEGVSAFETDYSESGKVIVTYAVAAEDSVYWVTSDGTFLTISGTVNASAEEGAVSPIAFEATDRETFEGSGETNSDIILGLLTGDSENYQVTDYSVTTSAGSVTVGSGSDTTDSTGDTSDSILKGDANVDGEVTIMDVITINKTILGKTELTAQGEKNADVNSNRIPDSEDTLMIMKYIVGLIEEL